MGAALEGGGGELFGGPGESRRRCSEVNMARFQDPAARRRNSLASIFPRSLTCSAASAGNLVPSGVSNLKIVFPSARVDAETLQKPGVRAAQSRGNKIAFGGILIIYGCIFHFLERKAVDKSYK